MQEKIRISKLLADRGICSRREADAYIEQGLVLLDGAVVQELGSKAYAHQQLELATKAKAQQQRRITVLLNKPIGVVSHEDPDRPYTPAIRLITPENLWQAESKSKQSPGIQNRSVTRGLAPAAGSTSIQRVYWS